MVELTGQRTPAARLGSPLALGRACMIALIFAPGLISTASAGELSNDPTVVLASTTPPSLRRPQPEAEEDKTVAPKTQEPTAKTKKQKPASSTFIDFTHYDIPGFDLDGGAAASGKGGFECEQTCKAVRGCVAYTYDIWNQQCYLKSGADVIRFDARAVSGVLEQLPPPRKAKGKIVFEYYSNSSFSGMALGPPRPAASRDKCESLCGENGECVAFTFSKSDNSCSIYHKPLQRFPETGSQSAGKVQR